MDTKKIGCVIQARMGSVRLPGKVMLKISGKSLLEHIVDRVRGSSIIKKVVVATSVASENDVIRDFGKSFNVDVFSGDDSDVLSRYIKAAEKFGLDIICRITADDPLVDIEEADRMVGILISEGLDYVTNSDKSIEEYGTDVPVGLQSEVTTYSALSSAYEAAAAGTYREHVTLYLEENPGKYRIKIVSPREAIKWKGLRLTVDTNEDFKLMSNIYKSLYEGFPLKNEKVISFLKANPALLEVNSGIVTEYKGLENIKVKH